MYVLYVYFICVCIIYACIVCIRCSIDSRANSRVVYAPSLNCYVQFLYG